MQASKLMEQVLNDLREIQQRQRTFTTTDILDSMEKHNAPQCLIDAVWSFDDEERDGPWEINNIIDIFYESGN